MNDTPLINILAVDDRPENLLALENLLEAPGRALFKAASGNEALGMLMEHEFALVLLDVQMPDMDGFETAELMRGNKRTRHIPIIFVTAISKDDKYSFKGYDAGAVDFLYKPIEPCVLTSKVNIFCDLYKQRLVIQNQLEQIQEQNTVLEKRLQEIKELRGLLPICSSCKKIRNDTGYWEVLEKYIRDHSNAEFTHSLCPDCIKQYYPSYYEKLQANENQNEDLTAE